MPPADPITCALSGFVPLFFGMPVVPAFTAGGTDVNLQNGQSLGPGTYGTLRVSNNASVTLAGGTYNFTGVELKSGAIVRFSGAATVRVSGRVLIGNGSSVGPAPASGITAFDVVWYATGVDGPPKKPANAFDIGSNATVSLNAFAPNGTTTIGSYAVATGAFLGKRVSVGSNVVLNENSAFLAP